MAALWLYVWTLVTAYPVETIALVVGAVVNLSPRPHPEDHVPGTWAYRFWFAMDRLSFLTAKRIPGRFKWFFAPSPESAPKATEEEKT